MTFTEGQFQKAVTDYVFDCIFKGFVKEFCFLVLVKGFQAIEFMGYGNQENKGSEFFSYFEVRISVGGSFTFYEFSDVRK